MEQKSSYPVNDNSLLRCITSFHDYKVLEHGVKLHFKILEGEIIRVNSSTIQTIDTIRDDQNVTISKQYFRSLTPIECFLFFFRIIK